MTRIEYLQAVIDSQKSPIEVFMQLQEFPNSAQIIDVRIGDKGFLGNKIMGAIEMPLPELENQLSFLKKTKQIYVTTWGGSCTLAKQASILLLNHGFNVLEIAGGNHNWESSKLPMEQIEVLK